MKLNPLVSVVVTAHNAAGSIGNCLQSLKDQKGISGEAMEVVLIDDRSNDDLFQRAQNVEMTNLEFFRIDRYVPDGLTARQKALDIGFRHARGRYIFVTDADGTAPDQWIQSTLDFFDRTGAALVAGPMEFRPSPRSIGSLQTVDAYVYLGFCRLLNRLRRAPGAFFGNMAFRREWYFSVGGFQAIGFSLTEDLAFVRAVHRAGGKISFQSGPAVRVASAPDWRAVIERSRRVSAGGWSLLALVIGVWFLSLPIGVLVGGLWDPRLLPFGVARYAAGAAMSVWVLPRTIRGQCLPYGLFYEPAAVLTGLWVMASLLVRRRIRWGGYSYPRRLTSARIEKKSGADPH